MRELDYLPSTQGSIGQVLDKTTQIICCEIYHVNLDHNFFIFTAYRQAQLHKGQHHHVHPKDQHSHRTGDRSAFPKSWKIQNQLQYRLTNYTTKLTVSHHPQGWSPTIQNLPKGSVQQTWNLAPWLNSQNQDQVKYHGWSATIPRMVTHHPLDGYPTTTSNK